jgi:hypothetical protein
MDIKFFLIILKSLKSKQAIFLNLKNIFIIGLGVLILSCISSKKVRKPRSILSHSSQIKSSRLKETPISINSDRGTISEEKIISKIHQALPQMLECYNQILKELPYISGQVLFHFWIKEDGLVKELKIEQSTLGNFELEMCIFEIMSNLYFPNPLGGKEAEFFFPLTLKPPVESSQFEITEKEVKEEALLEHEEDFEECGLPKDSFSFELIIYLLPTGKMASAGLYKLGNGTFEMVSCIIERMMEWQFEIQDSEIRKIRIAF